MIGKVSKQSTTGYMMDSNINSSIPNAPEISHVL